MNAHTHEKKDTFPEEMHKKQSSGTKKHNHNSHVLWWVVGLLVLLIIVFAIGMWTGRIATDVAQERNEEQRREQRTEAIKQQQPYTQVDVGSEARSERINNFFNN